MDTSSCQQVVFPLSKDGNDRIEYILGSFKVFSHKPNILPIELTHDGMKELCKSLESALLMYGRTKFDLNAAIQEAANGTTPLPVDKEILNLLIAKTYKNDIKLVLNTYEAKPYLWLREYGRSNNPLTPNAVYPCKGGSILNGVKLDELNIFVDGCIKA
jgi:hypothetical protein